MPKINKHGGVRADTSVPRSTGDGVTYPSSEVVSGNQSISGNQTVGGNHTVVGDATIGDALTVTGILTALGYFGAGGNFGIGSGSSEGAFFGATAIAKPTVTGARDSSEGALAALLVALDSLGLIDDNTTAS